MNRQIFLSLGSNVNRKQNIKNALKALSLNFGDLQISNIYQTRAVGFDGNDFYNLVVGFSSQIELDELSRSIKDIEDKNGRIRSAGKFSDRTLDIDILLYGDAVLYSDKLDIPRKEIEKYAFVLKPLAELAPNLVHPALGKTIAAMWRNFSPKQGLFLIDKSTMGL